jgi:hypothetical protein
MPVSAPDRRPCSPQAQHRIVAKPDWNWFGTLGVNYVHDFQTQTGETFEASVIAYDAQQFSLHQFDIGLVELRAGPRFAFSPGDVNGVTVKPYIVATGAALADAAYMGGIGGGLTVHATVAISRSTHTVKWFNKISAIRRSTRWRAA